MFPLRHGGQPVVADLHMADAGKDAALHGAVPDRRVIRQQTDPGYEIHPQSVVRQRRDSGQFPSFQRTPPFLLFQGFAFALQSVGEAVDLAPTGC